MSEDLRQQIEYSKSNRSTCKKCRAPIALNDLRIGLETKSRAFDGYDVSWYHLQCYKFDRVKYINQLKYFDMLRWDDFIKVREILKDTTPIQNALEKQNYNNDIWKIKDALGDDLKPAQIKKLYSHNYTLENLSPAQVLHFVADGMAYGRVGPCPNCKNLSVLYDGNHYYCRGWVTSYTKCDWYGPSIKRYRFSFPSDVKSKYLSEYTFPHAHPYEELTDYVAPNNNNKSGNTDDSADSPTTPIIAFKAFPPVEGSIFLAIDSDYPHSKGTIQVEQSDKYGYTAYNVTLIFADMVSGKNSLYKLQLIKLSASKYHVFRKWARVGTSVGGTAVDPFATLADAIKFFKTHFQDKTGYEWDDRGKYAKLPGKYFMVELEDSSFESNDAANNEPDESAFNNYSSSLPIETQDLLKIIYNFDLIKAHLKHMKLSVEKMPLGKISQRQIKSAYSVLTEIQEELESESPVKSKIVDASNRFYTLIPHDFGNGIPILIDNIKMLTEKIKMVDTMADIEIANNLKKISIAAGNSLDSNYSTLNTDLKPLASGSFNYSYLEQLALSTAEPDMLKFSVCNIFEVERTGESEAYSKWDHNPNKVLLWHGSRAPNWIGILGKGLRISPPEAPKTGLRFGKGVYFADSISVSLSYCGTMKDYPYAILALSEVALGQSEPLSNDKYMEQASFGYHSSKALGMRAPATFDDYQDITVFRGPMVASSLSTSCTHNEYIVYDVSQCRVSLRDDNLTIEWMIAIIFIKILYIQFRKFQLNLTVITVPTYFYVKQ
ncbi:polyADP-ribosyltransferase [Heterostelium album PN500]|uniref:Poly [ADP-ribose] polymerase n=1 Tax=Heterostelium pallidum (strain ATCC 26659 / Pp 5 / PN500) TaxID=670386 RepID=D3BQA7_HETP5|nr:polyADP-ribosyltransferase [Heterostelium album PN500]EFA76327.1 polyADP-ribosyltransferase [Heterostelium album PN500]|eukprot:XP_020428459.1 polyADP-ribosyltransferase [Heterostelium album PN500]